MLITVVIAMVVAVLLLPGMLLLLRRSAESAGTSADNDEGIAARAELAELFGSVDPIGECESPPQGAYRDICFRERRVGGASLIQTPEMPAAEPHPRAAACWLTTNPAAPDERQRRCIVLEGGSDELECDPANPTNCLRVLSETTGEPVNVDKHGGGLLLIRSWDEEPTDQCFGREYRRLTYGGILGDVPAVPFLPSPLCFPDASISDRVIYTDVEWSCMRWRHPYGLDLNRDGDTDDAGERAAYQWLGACPDPVDPTEDWPASAGLPTAAQAFLRLSGLQFDYYHSVGDRITDIELLVCVASERADRLQGKAHCSVDRMRFHVADAAGETAPGFGSVIVPDARVAVDGLSVAEGIAGELFVRLGLEPAVDIDVTVTIEGSPPGVSVTPQTLTFPVDDWDTPQRVTVTSPDDHNTDNETFTIVLTAASAPRDWLPFLRVDVTVVDDDLPQLVVGPRSLSVEEGGTAAEFNVRLTVAPSFVVAVTVVSDDPAVAAVSPASLTFTPTDFDISQPVTVTGTDDSDINDESVAVALTSSSIGDAYHGLTASVAVTVTDPDMPALEVSQSAVTVEEGSTATVTVSLATQPSADVTVTIASDDPAVATASPATLTIRASGWNTPRIITITGTDNTTFGPGRATLTLTSASPDIAHNGLTEDVTVEVTDNEISPYTADDAESYVEARDCVVQGMSHSAGDHGTYTYANNYRNEADWCSDGHLTNRGLSPLDPAIPLGQDDPNGLPSPGVPDDLVSQQDLRDAIDELAGRAGMTQSLIDTAGGG